jgi:hypothetical protein
MSTDFDTLVFAAFGLSSRHPVSPSFKWFERSIVIEDGMA